MIPFDETGFSEALKGCGYQDGYLALNVKVHNVHPVNFTGFEHVIWNFLLKDHRSLVGEVYGLAFEKAQRDWWEDADILAQDFGLGSASSTGRSGGWLSLSEVSEDYLEDLTANILGSCSQCGKPYDEHYTDYATVGEAAECLCVNCGLPTSRHVNGCCLLSLTFYSTVYRDEPSFFRIEPDNEQALKELDNIYNFYLAIKDLLAQVNERYTLHLKEEVRNRWPEVRRMRTEKFLKEGAF